MNNILEYKDYYTKIEYSAKDKVLFGKIEGIKDLVNFESESIDNIEKEFHNAVDDYLAMCKDLGETPDKPYKGIFNVRIQPDLHRKAAITADKRGETLNAFVAHAIENALSDETQPLVIAVPIPERKAREYLGVGESEIRSYSYYGSKTYQ